MSHKSLIRTLVEPMAIAIALAVVVRSAAHIYAIPSSSMVPTLATGDRILVTRYLTGEPERGDVIVFRSPLATEELMVKRVVGLPGDLVDSRLGRLRIGGHTLAEPYVLRQATTGAIESQIVPARSYYVLGDNREDSRDSRSWGCVPRELVVGRARMVLWSSSEEGETRAGATTLTFETTASGRNRSQRLFKWIE